MMNRALSKMSCCKLQPCLLTKQLHNNRNPSLYSPSRNLQSVGIVMNLRSRQQKQKLVARGYNPEISSGSYGEDRGKKEVEIHDDSVSKDSSSSVMKPNKLPLSLILAGLLLASCLIISAVAFVKGGPSAFMAAFAKSGFTAAFSLIFISEIGDKTFFIAALMAMQYDKGLVLLGSMVALSLMTILSVITGLLFHKVPAQFQTTLPIGEYAAVALLLYFGFKSIKNAWDLPSDAGNKKKDPSDLGEFTEAEELVKERVEKKLTAPLDIFRDVFSLIFFAEWGDRSMLATIALGAAQSPVGVASGAIAGHLVATLLAVLGGAFLANYISEKLVGYVGGGLFLVFAGATLLGVF